MKRKSTILPAIGELELEVLEHLWLVGEADVQETHAAVGAVRNISVNTVGSALERLSRKQLTARTKVSHAYRYRAAMTREVYVAESMVNAAGGLRALSDQGLLTAFVDVVGEDSDETLDELERLIRDKREQQAR